MDWRRGDACAQPSASLAKPLLAQGLRWARSCTSWPRAVSRITRLARACAGLG